MDTRTITEDIPYLHRLLKALGYHGVSVRLHHDGRRIAIDWGEGGVSTYQSRKTAVAALKRTMDRDDLELLRSLA